MPEIATEPRRAFREVSPPGYLTWDAPDQADRLKSLRQNIQLWLADVAASELLFKEHIYDNLSAPSDWDYRQHRCHLARLIWGGEAFAMELIGLKESHPEAEIDLLLQQADAKTRELIRAFAEWHSPLEAKNDLPESFATGLAEAASGKLVPFKLPA